MSNLLRVAVSKQKRRYQKNGYDLDLAYITDNIIAMGFPSEKVEGVFRNPMKDVQRFLDQYHKDHFKVYNLCSERVYDHSKFYGRVGYYPFDDHNAPQFEMIDAFCRDVDAWMKEDSKNIAVIHCKAGKGRTGLMICCWLMYCGMWKNTEDSLRFYAALRTYNQKGVTIPSQIRYVGYFGRSIRESMKYAPRNAILKKLVLKPLPKEINLSEVQFNISVGKNCVFNSKEQNMNVVISKKKKTIPDKKDKKDPKKKLTKENSEKNIDGQQLQQQQQQQQPPQQSSPNLQSLNASGTINSGSNVGTVNGNTLHQLGGSQFSLSDLADINGGIGNDEYISFEIGSLPLAGDIRIEFTNKQDDRMFMFWVNTSFVQTLEIIPKSGLDKAHKDKNHKAYPEDFHVELTFDQVEQSHTTVVASAEEQTNNQHYPQSSNNVATSSSHHDNITVVASDAPQNNNNNNLNSSNNNNNTTTSNNISLASSQSNPVQQEQPSTTTTTQENSTPKVEAEKIENSNASANDSETSSNSSS
ncbi:hypothetical protein RB653_000187 [Dictyostelium firmibasis]|uniref:Phosphatidylinositol 3,4,5-trisphosphate 3-phosphatase and dual-specificity protein phosphatase PTEN n=1 Tax=Dictyostelium firmibasis TaxID=79012 RepID=A0AAN7YQH6_9MYCE